MNTKKSIFSVWASILLVLVLLAGCASAPTKDAKAKGKINSLAAWKGEWKSFDTVIGSSKLDEAYRNAAQKKPNYTVDGLKAAVYDMYTTPFAKVKFDGSNKVVFTVVSSDGSKKEIACEYKYAGQIPVKGFDGHFWEAFEAVQDVKGLSKAKYMVLFPPHQHGKDGLLHWHGRFGAAGFEALNNESGWPTYVSGKMSEKELLEHVDKSVNAVQWYPDSPLEPYKGKWMNSSLIYDDNRPAVQAVYKKLIAEFAGKNPKGGDFTKEEIVAAMKKVYGTADEYTHLEFIIEDGKNDMIVWKEDRQVARIAYKRDKAFKGSMLAVKAVDAASAKNYALLSLTAPRGTPSHFHFWNGKTVEDTNSISIKPTCIPADTPEDLVAMRVEKSCRKILSGLVK